MSYGTTLDNRYMWLSVSNRGMLMATFSVDLNDLCELTILGGYQGQTVLNVFHYNYIGGSSRPDGPACVGALAADFFTKVINPVANPLLALLTTAWGFRYLRVQIVNPTRKPYVDYDAGVQTGTLAVDGIPSDTNMTVSLRTLAVGRGLTGNKKFTALPLTSITQNLFTSGTRTSWNTWATNLQQDLNDDTPALNWRPVVWSRRRPTDRRPLFSVAAQAEVRVLRRREYGKGV